LILEFRLSFDWAVLLFSIVSNWNSSEVSDDNLFVLLLEMVSSVAALIPEFVSNLLKILNKQFKKQIKTILAMVRMIRGKIKLLFELLFFFLE
jgi:hypothetical protein